MASFANLLKRVLVRAPGCSDALAQQALLDSAIQFCDDTHILTGELEPFDTQIGVTEYELIPEEVGVEIAMLDELYADNFPLRAVSREGLRTREYTARTRQSMPCEYERVRPGTVRLYPVPDRVYTMRATAILRPTRDATTLPDQLEGPWRDALVAGALVDLFSVPDQPFTNPEAIPFYASTLGAWRTKAKNEKLRGFSRSKSRVDLRASRFV